MAIPWNAIASGGSGLLGSITSIINTNKSVKANKQLASDEFKRNVQMWNMQNEYNSPSAQMQRFKDAGLNPNLIYGQGTAGNATTLPKYQAPRMEYNYEAPKLGEALQLYQNLKIQDTQNEKLKAEKNLIEQNIANKAFINSMNSIYGKNFYLYRNQNALENVKLNQEKVLEKEMQNKYREETLWPSINKYAVELKKSQLDYNMNLIRKSNLDLEKQMNEIDLKYMKWGSPAWQTGLGLARVISDGLRKRK